jgi:hypothetical protein
MSLRKCTPEEADLVHWLMAESEWKLAQARAAYHAAEASAYEVKLAEGYQRNAGLLADHERLVASAAGLRRAVLELHSPGVYDDDPDPLICSSCPGGRDYDPPFPCATYALARDWQE